MAEGDYELVLEHGAGTLTITPASALVEGDPILERFENRPQRAQFTLLLPDVASQNLMSPTCSLWSSGTGALEIGDRVRLSLYPTSTRAKTAVFTGLVHELKAVGDNLVSVEAREDWAQYETLQRDAIIFADHKDLVYNYTSNDANGQTTIEGLSGADIALPLAVIDLMSGENVEELAPGGENLTGTTPAPEDRYLAQRFVANGDALIAVRWRASFNGYPNDTNFYVGIWSDDNGKPGTYYRRTVTLPSVSIPRDATVRDYWTDFRVDGVPFILEEGKHYWVVFYGLGANTQLRRQQIHKAPNLPPGAGLTPVKRSADGSAWINYDDASGPGTWGGSGLSLSLYVASYERQADIAQSLSGSTLTLLGDKKVQGVPMNLTSTPPASIVPTRARVSYYHGTRTVREVLQDLIGRGACPHNVSADVANTVKLYRTKGKRLAECIREICDLRMSSGNYAGSQLAVAQLPYATELWVRRRKHTGDASSFTFSYGTDTSTDNERRIIAGSVQLKRTTKMKPTKVWVIGKAADNVPLVAIVHDRAVAGLSSRLGYDVEETLQDDSLQTLEDCRAYGKAYLDAARGSYDTWEGQLTISGVYPDLFDLSAVSPTYGSGQIITLNYSPLGISALKCKVKAIRVQGVKTEVTLSSEDLLVNNPFSDVAWRTARSESFISPADAEHNVIMTGHRDSVLPAALNSLGSGQLYMELQNANGITQGSAVACTVMTDSGYNLKMIHAEFEASNGSTAPNYPITQVRLRDAAGANSIQIPIEPCYKWKTTRAIVELTVRLS